MPRTVPLTVSVPKFDEVHYLQADPSVIDAIKSGAVDSPLEHYLRHGVDQNRYALVRREPTTLSGSAERFLVSQSGFCLLVGWLADEGCDQPRYRLLGGDFSVELPVEATFRHARSDVETGFKSGAYDYGFVAFGRSPSKSLLKQSLLLQITAVAGAFQAKVTPEIVSDKRMLDTLLEMIATCQAHAGVQSMLSSFLSGPAGDTAIELFQAHVATSISGHFVERFGVRPVSHSFVTVLFGSTEPVMVQPLLFRAANIDFGEWIYVCNSPEDGVTVLRLARLMSELYDVMITVMILGDNAGFGAANNVAVEHAASGRIFIINPDVYPLAAHAKLLQLVLSDEDLGANLWGGLLFYDDDNLMHSGMYIERDSFVRRNSLNRVDGPAALAPRRGLLRVEHFDKGVPFEEQRWQKAQVVPAITGAVMAFKSQLFEKLGGFSTRYIYGHYEDADLSLRWSQEVGPVAIHPHIRLVHLEGQGSTAKGAQYRGAAIANRYFFSSKHGSYFDENRAKLSKVPEASR
jgi:GT2 family glycosyltransferase